MQMATAGSPCAQFARRIERCNAAFGARRSVDDCERSRRKSKCLHAVDDSVQECPTDRLTVSAKICPDRSRSESSIRYKQCTDEAQFGTPGNAKPVQRSAADVRREYGVKKHWSTPGSNTTGEKPPGVRNRGENRMLA
jgi:hypothetical protein